MTVFSLGGTASNDIHGHKFVNSPEPGSSVVEYGMLAVVVSDDTAVTKEEGGHASRSVKELERVSWVSSASVLSVLSLTLCGMFDPLALFLCQRCILCDCLVLSN